MKISSPLISHVIEVDDEHVTSLVIENASLFRKFIEGMYLCIENGDDAFVFSQSGKILNASSSVELIATLVPFSLNTKTLLGALAKKLEKLALSAEVLERTENITRAVIAFIRSLTLEYSHDISCENLSISTIIKGCGLTFSEEDLDLSERLIGYFRLVREFAGERLFVLVNLRTYLAEEEVENLLALCLLEHFQIFLIDVMAYKKLTFERRLIVDKDLCEITSDDDIVV